MGRQIQRNTGRYSFSSVTNMRAFLGGTGLKDGEYADLNAGSNAGGFKWDASSTESDDGIDTIKLTSVTTGRFIRRKEYNQGGVGAMDRTQASKNQESVSIGDFTGVDTTGATDSSAAFISAAGIGGDIFVPSGTFRIENPVVFSLPVRITAAKDAKIVPSIGLAGGKVFAFETDDVYVDGLLIDGTGETFTPATGNTYGIFGGDGVTKYKNHTYKNCSVRNLEFSDGNTGSANNKVSHGIYVDNVDNVMISDCEINTTSGAAIFIRDIIGLYCCNNTCIDNMWYPIHCAGGIFNYSVDCNTIKNTTTNGVYYGGGIDWMNQHSPLETRSERGTLNHNHFEGNFSYGAVMRVFSCENTEVVGNTGEAMGVGSVALTPDVTFIRLDTRGTGVGAENGPFQNAWVRDNIAECPSSTGEHRLIYCGNQFQSANNPAKNLHITGNIGFQNGSGNAFAGAILLHGFDGGIENVWIEDNYCETELTSTQPVIGAIGLTGNSANGTVRNVHIGKNTMIDIAGTPASSFQVGIGLNAYCDDIYNDAPNTLDNYFYGVRSFANSGPTLEKLDDQVFKNIVSANTLESVLFSRYGKPLVGTATYDPPSLASGATTFTDVTVTGCSVGDSVSAAFSLDQQGVIFSGYVRTSNSARVYLENKTGGAIDLASGTITVVVNKN